ncbi:hypothetical protein TOPH_06338 [Tolypocladium ophioglossoides CBS 100239]|uniref:Beta-lactamase-like ARB-00930-like C-terminal domain-containing protein n=1 Tax=Tolypocladium ophioglossoides (strain CBS 100239) TaxID=1163406 RepID=A0A0L0N5F9_TOLOC|nr:hypothetical protein TOPH_06338 [Tolypocladium ophioglossoides CBS 100239]
MFSTTADLITLSQAILQNRLLPPEATRLWMQPASDTSIGQAGGTAWETLRSDTASSTKVQERRHGGRLGVIMDTATDAEKKELDSQLFFKDRSDTWFIIEGLAYDYLALIEFAFIMGKDGAATDIKNLTFNVTTTKDRV